MPLLHWLHGEHLLPAWIVVATESILCTKRVEAKGCKAKKQYKVVFFLVKNKYDRKSVLVLFSVFLKQTLQDFNKSFWVEEKKQ